MREGEAELATSAEREQIKGKTANVNSRAKRDAAVREGEAEMATSVERESRSKARPQTRFVKNGRREGGRSRALDDRERADQRTAKERRDR